MYNMPSTDAKCKKQQHENVILFHIASKQCTLSGFVNQWIKCETPHKKMKLLKMAPNICIPFDSVIPSSVAKFAHQINGSTVFY